MNDPVAIARRMMETGDIDGAMSLLDSARGNARAAAEVANLYMRGTIIARDLFRARHYLRRAADLGHVGAAMDEIALTANGGGGAPDWAAAYALLEIAAEHDPIAQDHLKKLERMDLDEHGYPISFPIGTILDQTISAIHFRSFLTPEECQHIAAIAYPVLEVSTVFDPTTGQRVINPIRRSHGAVISPTEEDLVIQSLLRRIAVVTHTDVMAGESVSVLRYDAGGEYKPHYDRLTQSTNNRIKTAIIYLNDSFDGGETYFPKIPFTFKPTAGDALVFNSVNSDGKLLLESLHAGLPVTLGQKWIMTRWIREAQFDPWCYSEENPDQL